LTNTNTTTVCFSQTPAMWCYLTSVRKADRMLASFPRVWRNLLLGRALPLNPYSAVKWPAVYEFCCNRGVLKDVYGLMLTLRNGVCAGVITLSRCEKKEPRRRPLRRLNSDDNVQSGKWMTIDSEMASEKRNEAKTLSKNPQNDAPIERKAPRWGNLDQLVSRIATTHEIRVVLRVNDVFLVRKTTYPENVIKIRFFFVFFSIDFHSALCRIAIRRLRVGFWLKG